MNVVKKDSTMKSYFSFLNNGDVFLWDNPEDEKQKQEHPDWPVPVVCYIKIPAVTVGDLTCNAIQWPDAKLIQFEDKEVVNHVPDATLTI